uniref:WW domain-containing protein n=1 Tax=Leptocylindrus danicus TaxID=163516 RepID=A0A7S2LLN0_9STRA|mmetsp:Transcript_7275/g.10870  ORF Transcript_7275/g.10870 Transcript_7275/m.10870 type:complete len:116 (+) Transcript_7275:94-441(+)
MRGPPPPPPPPFGQTNNEGRLFRQMEAMRLEVKRQRMRAEDAEREMDRLKEMVNGLESALAKAIGDTKTSKYVNAECINNDGDVIANEWVVVEDPDSDDVFYMNEETGEMKWDLN